MYEKVKLTLCHTRLQLFVLLIDMLYVYFEKFLGIVTEGFAWIL